MYFLILKKTYLVWGLHQAILIRHQQPQPSKNENHNSALPREDTLGEAAKTLDETPTPVTSMTKRIKVIGPWHPTRFESEISNIKILPYSQQPAAHLTAMAPDDTPRSYQEAMESTEPKFWLEEIRKEINSMIQLKVWEQAEDNGQQKVGTIWVFKKKRDHTAKVVE